MGQNSIEYKNNIQEKARRSMKFIYKKNSIQCRDENTDLILGEVDFETALEGLIEVTHTYVSPSCRGQGIGDQLMHALADELRERRLKAYLSCSYAVKWFYKHPEYQDLVQDFNCCS